MLYETAARSSEVLALDIQNLDRRNRRSKVTRKGSAVDIIVWQTGTARLLPRLLVGRTRGPVFLTDRRARVALAAADLDPATGRARLSYRRAEEVFTELTKPLAHPDITDPAQLADAPGWALHDLRHSALTHAAENGANTGTLLAYSGHSSVASLARYTRVSPEASPAGRPAATPIGDADQITAPGRGTCSGLRGPFLPYSGRTSTACWTRRQVLADPSRRLMKRTLRGERSGNVTAGGPR